MDGHILNNTFEIVHIPGTRNGLADDLSRLYPNLWGIPCMWTSVTTLNSISLEPHIVTEEHRLVIQRFHSLGHFGMKSVLRDLRHNDYKWRGMLEDIREQLQSREVYQKWTLSARYFHEMRPNQHGITSNSTSTPIFPTPDGYCYCL